jgi:hypothetical protein
MLQLQGRGVYPTNLGHVPRKVGLHGHLLEFCRRPICEPVLSPCLNADSDVQSRQTYVYSVVYMASHEPEKYRFSTTTYIALFATLITAYYV